MKETWKTDCRHFLGERPCKFKRVCAGCGHFCPMGHRTLIIKLGAMGDVLRTTPLLRALRKEHPDGHISWLTRYESLDLLRYNDFIDRVLPFDIESVLRLEVEEFDKLICLDKEAGATALAMKVKAADKCGFGMSSLGALIPLNEESNYSYRLGLDDDFKFKINRKTYQETALEAAKLKYRGEEYILGLGSAERAHAEQLCKRLGVKGGDFIVGLSTQVGSVFANKALSTDLCIELARRFGRRPRAKVLLLGGRKEQERNSVIKTALKGKLLDCGPDNTVGEFCAIVERCNLVVTGDTLSMHVAIGLKVPLVVVFGSTCSQEIDLYGRGDKVLPKVDCAPCYKKECGINPNCMALIDADEVYSRSLDLIEGAHQAGARRAVNLAQNR